MEKENPVYFDQLQVECGEYTIGKPRICYITIPDYCFMRCKMCATWKNKFTLPPVSLKQWEFFFASLKSFLGKDVVVSIAGGEVFMHRDIFNLIEMIDDFGFNLHLISNGYLINDSVAQKIAASNLKCIGISLDGLNSQTHDYLRGRPDSFARAMNAIKCLRGANSKLQIGIKTIIMEKNKDEIIPLVQWVQENKDLNWINFQAIMQPFGEATDPDWYRKDKYKELWPQNLDKMCTQLDSLIKLKESGFAKISNSTLQLEDFKEYFKSPQDFIRRKPVCSFMDYGINVNYQGAIYLCTAHDSIGSIFDDFRKTYNSIKAQEVRKKIISCNKNCHMLINCSYED